MLHKCTLYPVPGLGLCPCGLWSVAALAGRLTVWPVGSGILRCECGREDCLRTEADEVAKNAGHPIVLAREGMYESSGVRKRVVTEVNANP